jgi:nucleotide-binding universal stress UspA family protein
VAWLGTAFALLFWCVEIKRRAVEEVQGVGRAPSTDISEEQQVDLMAVGARGRTAAALLLGSITERLIRSTEIPLIAVKKKGTGLSLLAALYPP